MSDENWTTVRVLESDKEALKQLREALMKASPGSIPEDLAARLRGGDGRVAFTYGDVLGVAIAFSLRSVAERSDPEPEVAETKAPKKGTTKR